ncbi:MAG: hypothetical protein RIF41_36075 [Polyangiaceae bacterium]
MNLDDVGGAALEIRYAKEPMVVRSLGDAGGIWVPFALVGGLLAAIGVLPLLGKLGLFSGGGPVVKVFLIGYIVFLGVGLFVGGVQIRKWRFRRQLRWLRTLPFSFNLEGYLSAMGRESVRARPTATLVFEAPVPADERSHITSQLERVPNATNARWQGDHLVVEGPSVEASFTSDRDGGRRTTHNNGRVHHWVRRFVDSGVLPVHARQPLESLRITVSA